MKKILIAILLIMLPLIVFAYPKGDVNGNNKVDSGDYILVKKHILKQSVLKDNIKSRADVNGDGIINSIDYITIKKLILGKDNDSNGSVTLTNNSMPTKIHFIDIWYGDATLVESNGEYGLIDVANPSTGAYKDKNENGRMVLKYLESIGVKHLKFVIGSHAHSDHIGGLPELVQNSNLVDKNTTFIYKDIIRDSSKFGEIVLAPTSSYTTGKYINTAAEWDSTGFLSKAKNAMKSKGAVLLEVSNHSKSKMTTLGAKYVSNSDSYKAYITFTMGDLEFKIYNLPLFTQKDDNNTYIDINTNSLVTIITSKSTGKKIWLSGDLNTRAGFENYYAKLIGKVDIFKTNHHGSLYSNSRSLLSKIKPNYVVGDVINEYEKNIAPYTYVTSYGGKIYSIDDRNKNYGTPVVFTIGSDISASKNPTTISAKKGWYQWTDVNEDMAWVYVKNNKLLKDGFNLIGGVWYYFDNDGVMQTGWVKDKGSWYYMETEQDATQGSLVTNTNRKINGTSYHFNASGACDSSNCK